MNFLTENNQHNTSYTTNTSDLNSGTCWCFQCRKSFSNIAKSSDGEIRCPFCHGVCEEMNDNLPEHEAFLRDFPIAIIPGTQNPWADYDLVVISEHPLIMGFRRKPKREIGLTEDQMATIPTEIVEEELEEQCSVCHNEFLKGESLCRLPCKHNFHENCIKQWLASKNSCPICRKSCL